MGYFVGDDEDEEFQDEPDYDGYYYQDFDENEDECYDEEENDSLF